MNKQAEDYLFSRFPFFFRHTQDTRMCDGFTHDDGWYEIVYKFLLGVEKFYIDHNIPTDKWVEIFQIKEKMGRLVIYINSSVSPEEAGTLYGLCLMATARSYDTCEACGAHGRMSYDGGCYKTLCIDCMAELDFSPQECYIK